MNEVHDMSLQNELQHGSIVNTPQGIGKVSTFIDETHAFVSYVGKSGWGWNTAELTLADEDGVKVYERQVQRFYAGMLRSMAEKLEAGELFLTSQSFTCDAQGTLSAYTFATAGLEHSEQLGVTFPKH